MSDLREQAATRKAATKKRTPKREKTNAATEKKLSANPLLNSLNAEAKEIAKAHLEDAARKQKRGEEVKFGKGLYQQAHKKAIEETTTALKGGFIDF